MGRGNFEGEGVSHCKLQGHSALCSHLCKMAEPIEVLFMGCALGWAQGIVLDGVQIPRMGSAV